MAVMKESEQFNSKIDLGIIVPNQGFSENAEISRKHLSEVEGLAKVF